MGWPAKRSGAVVAVAAASRSNGVQSLSVPRHTPVFTVWSGGFGSFVSVEGLDPAVAFELGEAPIELAAAPDRDCALDARGAFDPWSHDMTAPPTAAAATITPAAIHARFFILRTTIVATFEALAWFPVAC